MDNLQNIAGKLIGFAMRYTTSKRFTKEQRGSKWFSTVAANLTADRQPCYWMPYR
jgi:hypothetical protein